MKRFDVAHIREQGTNIILVPLDSAFGHKTPGEQNEIIGALQYAASSAGLAGTVVPAWLEGGRPRFIGPSAWGSYLRILTWDYVVHNVNRELTIS